MHCLVGFIIGARASLLQVPFDALSMRKPCQDAGARNRTAIANLQMSVKISSLDESKEHAAAVN